MKIVDKLLAIVQGKICKYFLLLRGYNIPRSMQINGWLKVRSYQSDQIEFGENVVINCCSKSNPLIKQGSSIVMLRRSAKLYVGNSVGMSGVQIMCAKSISISDMCMIGANSSLYDTDFHCRDEDQRILSGQDVEPKTIIIRENVFIGAECMILAGASIGENTTLGARSCVRGRVDPNSTVGGYIK